MTGNLGERIPVSGSRNELDQLGATINEMLDRINALMESLRQVSNDIAHDLRTPLTHLRQKLERARLAAPSLDQYGEAVDGAMGDCDELIAMFGALLRIAQIEAGVRRSAMRLVDLSEILRNVLSLYTPLLDDSGHPFRVELDENLWINGDRQLLLRMFANLLDNAIRHTSSGTPIAISTLRSAEKTVVTIADKGAGIPPSDREKVFQRFFRRESSRTTPGSGLGLSLVGAIAELHECRIVLSDNAPGLRVSIEFSAVKLQEVPRAAE
jgi:signal transduction histidine kinase